MADLNPAESKLPRGEKRNLLRPKRRARIRIDMTPMVDIAFLLLIFYMVTTVFSRPTRMEITIPSKDSSHEPVKVKESKLLCLYVDETDRFYYKIGEDMEKPEMVDFDRLAGIIDQKNRGIDGLVMVLKIDQDASYTSMVRIIDTIQSVERAINMEYAALRKADPDFDKDDYSVRFSLQDMSRWDEIQLDQARAVNSAGL